MGNTPQDFDFADWFGNVGAPEESVDVYTRTDLIGEITALQRRISEADEASGAVGERSLEDEMSDEEAKLAELLEAFQLSRVTFYLRGLSQEERIFIRKAHEASGQPDHAFALRCVAKSVVALRRPGTDRTPTTLRLGDIEKLHRQLGEGQMSSLFQAYQQATSGVPQVDADFLLRRSGQGDSPE